MHILFVMMDYLSQERFKYQQVDFNSLPELTETNGSLEGRKKNVLIHRSSSMLWEMIVSNVTCMKIEYIRLKHAKWTVWSFKINSKRT
ncbi:hypothetical protein LDENG_00192720 [Lucifuga dentata]|nr:hypothetical protein LDENG_00192720 [Lucifuga dentata]